MAINKDNQILLFFRKDIGRYFIVVPEGFNIYCKKCGKVIELAENVYIHKSYSKILPFEKSFYCSIKCMAGAKNKDQDERYTAILSYLVPQNAKIIDDFPTEMKPAKNISIFDSHKLESGHTTDNTKYTGRESIGGASIGDPKFLEKPEKDLISLDEALDNEKKKKPVTLQQLEAENGNK